MCLAHRVVAARFVLPYFWKNAFLFCNMLFLLKGLEDLAGFPKLKNLNCLIACWERCVFLLPLALDLKNVSKQMQHSGKLQTGMLANSTS